MSTSFNSAKSLINDMLNNTVESLEKDLRRAIESQTYAYKQAKESTFRKVLGESNSAYDLTQHFKYQSTIGNVLKEMERSYLEYFGKPWNYVEPVQEEPVHQYVPKRGRPRKSN
jgi:hypothetical protein